MSIDNDRRANAIAMCNGKRTSYHAYDAIHLPSDRLGLL